MTTPLLIYICITAACALLACWVSASALLTEPEVSGLHRGVAVVGSLGAILVVGTAMVTQHFGLTSMHWVTSFLPAVCIAAAWSVMLSMKSGGMGTRLLSFPILVYNLLLAGVYTTITLQEIGGISLGGVGATLASADAFVQTRIGHPAALENPNWYHVPLVLPLGTGLAAIGSTTVATAVATVLLGAFGMALPHASSHARSYHESTAAQLDETSSDQLGCKVPWGTADLTEVEKLGIRNHLGNLGARWVTFETDLAALRDPGRQLQMREEIEWARGMNIKTCVITRPAARFFAFPASSLLELSSDMSEAQQMAAAKLNPDLLVLYAGPFGRLARLLSNPAGVSEWLDVIARSANEVRKSNQTIQLCVSFDAVDSQAHSMFAQLRGGGAHVDVVGLSIYPGERSLDQVETDLDVLRRWLNGGGSDPVMVIECGAVPQVHGGEAGQWSFLSRVLALGQGEIEIDVVCVDALVDKHRDRGLLTFSGRRRMAYEQLQRRSSAAAPGK